MFNWNKETKDDNEHVMTHDAILSKKSRFVIEKEVQKLLQKSDKKSEKPDTIAQMLSAKYFKYAVRKRKIQTQHHKGTEKDPLKNCKNNLIVNKNTPKNDAGN